MVIVETSFPSAPIDECFAIECSNCGKTTWKGCGLHIDRVMSAIPEVQRCTCPRN